ncbi:MAG: pyridoxal phosphate-dependent aminotransferase [Gracilibacteraceae bacterium]|jgi:aspartate/methionine/tyrosine aminotransferase|nr:pyridoxal phosphate-dependent aminotransferase [Gracilibacteraceae bacterium]
MKHKFLSRKYWNTISTPMAEVVELAYKYDDIINLSLGDPDLITNSEIIAKAFEDAKKGYTRYADSLGDQELRDGIIQYYYSKYGYKVEMNEVMVTVGACHGMYLVLQAIFDEGDEVIVPEPYFTPYALQIQLAGGKLVPLKTREEDDYQIDIDSLNALITKRTKAIIINSPNNPTGACLSRKTIEAIAETAISKDLIVISDDVYGSFSFGEPFIPIAAIAEMKERTITLGSFSKDYAMTGWRIGYVLAPDYIISCIRDINEGICFSAPSISQRAAIQALKIRDKVQPGLVEEYRRRVFYAYERINRISWMSVNKPQGSFYLFPNIKKSTFTSTEIARRILEDAHVLVVPGNGFGESGEGYIRIACTVDINSLKEAFDRIENINIKN